MLNNQPDQNKTHWLLNHLYLVLYININNALYGALAAEALTAFSLIGVCLE